MRDTKSEIIRIADDLIRSKGYNAFSYADISKVLKIKNATIHYYFPTKSDLGVEVINNTISNFKQETKIWKSLPYREQLYKWVTLYDQSKTNGYMCIMGALSSAHDTLSEDMQTKLERMANMILEWLTTLLEKGKEANVFHYAESSKTKAYLIQSSLLASLLLNRVVNNDAYQIIQDGILKI